MPAKLPVELVATETGCLVDKNHKPQDNGYVRIWNTTVKGELSRDYLHRITYRQYYGEESIPPGWEVDHMCRNRACANPKHLRALHPQVHLSLTARLKNDDREEAARMIWEIYSKQLNGRELAEKAGIYQGTAQRYIRRWKAEDAE